MSAAARVSEYVMATFKEMQQPGSPRQPLCTTGRDCGCATFSNRLRWVLGSALIASSLACVLTMLVMDTDCNVECERVVEQRFGEEIDITDADECQPNSAYCKSDWPWTLTCIATATGVPGMLLVLSMLCFKERRSEQKALKRYLEDTAAFNCYQADGGAASEAAPASVERALHASSRRTSSASPGTSGASSSSPPSPPQPPLQRAAGSRGSAHTPTLAEQASASKRQRELAKARSTPAPPVDTSDVPFQPYIPEPMPVFSPNYSVRTHRAGQLAAPPGPPAPRHKADAAWAPPPPQAAASHTLGGLTESASDWTLSGTGEVPRGAPRRPAAAKDDSFMLASSPHRRTSTAEIFDAMLRSGGAAASRGFTGLLRPTQGDPAATDTCGFSTASLREAVTGDSAFGAARGGGGGCWQSISVDLKKTRRP